MQDDRRSPHIASVAKAFRALTLIGESGGATSAKELASLMKAPLPTTYHLLNTLVAEGVIVRGERHGYLLGPRMGALADAYFEQGEPLELLDGPLRQLATRTGETAYLSAWRHGDLEVVSTAEGSHAVRVAQLQRGAHGHAHARASGKLLLALARAGQREEYLSRNALVQLTKNTMTDPAVLEVDFDSIRASGYAVDNEEFLDEVSCLAAPIMRFGHVLGSYTVSCPTSRFARVRDELLKELLAACNEAGQLFDA
jgi:IclR family acetate operon transcriptional repressor